MTLTIAPRADATRVHDGDYNMISLIVMIVVIIIIFAMKVDAKP